MPGVDGSTHGGRSVFSIYGPRDMGFARSEAKVILDHFEGIEPDDVTGRFYSVDPAVGRKRQMMEKWIVWLSTGVPKQSEPTAVDGLRSTRKANLQNRYGDQR